MHPPMALKIQVSLQILSPPELHPTTRAPLKEIQLQFGTVAELSGEQRHKALRINLFIQPQNVVTDGADLVPFSE